MNKQKSMFERIDFEKLGVKVGNLNEETIQYKLTIEISIQLCSVFHFICSRYSEAKFS